MRRGGTSPPPSLEPKMENFQSWYKEVDSIIAARIGLGIEDMPDLVFLHDLMGDCPDPEDAAQALLETWAEEGELPWELI